MEREFVNPGNYYVIEQGYFQALGRSLDFPRDCLVDVGRLGVSAGMIVGQDYATGMLAQGQFKNFPLIDVDAVGTAAFHLLDAALQQA
jgi:hypothetical protein